jgi:RNA polymerase sigma factor (sigma-70 family)
MMHDTDITLVQRFATAGDAEAFTEIVNRYGGLVYSICRRILRDQARAQDASQNTFFQLLRNPQKVTESLSGWLHAVATRAAIDVVRQDSSRQKREKEYTSMKSAKTHRWEDVSPHIDEALNELPEASRVILVNHFLAGKTEKDLAVELGVSQPTVSRRKKKALSELREKLGKKGVLVGIGALGTLLLSAASEAAPIALLVELGKMAMLSGWKPHVGANASNKSSTVGGTGISGSKDSVIATTAVTLAAIAGILGFFDILHLKPSPTGTDGTIIVAEDGSISRKEGVSGKDRVFALHTTTRKTTEQSIGIHERDRPSSETVIFEGHTIQRNHEITDATRRRYLNADKDSAVGDLKELTIAKQVPTEDTLKQEVVALPDASLIGVSVGTLTHGGERRVSWDFGNVEFTITGQLGNRRVVKVPPPAYPAWADKRGLRGNLKLSVKAGRDGKTVGTVVIISTTGYPEWDNAVVEWVKSEWLWKESSGTTPGLIGFNFAPNPWVHRKKKSNTKGKEMSTEGTLKRGIVRVPVEALKGAQIGMFTTRGAGVSGNNGKVELDTMLLGDVGAEEGKKTDWKTLLDEARWNVEFAVMGPLAERQAIRSIPMGYFKHTVVRNAATELKVQVLVNPDGEIEGTRVIKETGGHPQWADGAIDCFKEHWRWEKSSSSTWGYVLCRLTQAKRPSTRDSTRSGESEMNGRER